jgi:hypothetical protein
MAGEEPGIIMSALHNRLEPIREALGSPRQADRVGAMQQLVQLARKDSRVRVEALAIFERAIDVEEDRWTAIHAARGIASIAGPEAVRAAWLTLLNRPQAETVSAVAYAINDPAYIPVLLDVLKRRPEVTIRSAVLRALGRSKDPAMLPMLVDGLATPELRPDVVQAMTDLGDPRAIPHLQTLLGDTTDAWEEDNHGPMQRVCDLATTAIERLRLAAGPAGATHGSASGATAPRAALGPKPRVADVLRNLAAATVGLAMSAGGVWLAATGRTGQDRLAGVAGAVLFGIAGVHGISGLTQSRALHLQQHATGGATAISRWGSFAPYIPLAAILATVPWMILSVLLLLFLVGDKPFRSTPAITHLFQAFISVPALLGLLAGVVVLCAGMVRTRTQGVCFVLGCVTCTLFLIAVVSGRIR